MDSAQPRDAAARHIDPELGLLKGEGALQRAPEGENSPAPSAALWNEPSLRQVATDPSPDYYGRPALKKPVWIWSVPLYFQISGTSGAAAVLAAALQAGKRKDLSALRRVCRWIGALGTTIGGALLTYDLGRPSRFLNMLRVVRPTSPMSLGSWTLAKSGGALSLSLLAETRSPLAPVGQAAGAAGGLLGIPLAGYTGVLLGNSAVPLWQAARKPLPVLFTGSAASGLGDLIEFTPLTDREKTPARRLGTLGKVVELAGMQAVEKEAEKTPEVARPLKEGTSGSLWRTAKGLTAAALVLGALPSGRRRWQKPAAAALGVTGSLMLRYALTEAGKVSSQDPQANFRQQRRRLEERETAGDEVKWI